MPVQYLLVRAALPLRRLPLLRQRSFARPLRVMPDGRLRCRGLRLRLHGLSDAEDAAALAASLRRSLAGGLCCWRVLSADRDGCLAILLRVDGRNIAEQLLRDGLVRLRGCGSRRLRAAEEQARRQRRGVWRFAQERAVREEFPSGLVLFPWWQG